MVASLFCFLEEWKGGETERAEEGVKSFFSLSFFFSLSTFLLFENLLAPLRRFTFSDHYFSGARLAGRASSARRAFERSMGRRAMREKKKEEK